MKLSRFARLVKAGGFLYLSHVGDSGVWLGTRAGFYRATGLPDTVNADTILTILDFDSKAMEKITVNEQDFESVRDVFGMNLSDDPTPDIEVKKIPVAAVYNGIFATALMCDDGELVFYDEALLSPLADVLKESDYVHTVVRVDPAGRRYIVIRDGFDTIAGFMPMRIINKDYLGELQNFEALCVEQLMKDEARALRAAERAAAEAEAESGGEQVTTDEMEG